MKCSKCGYEWNALLPNAVISMVCPSCQQKMYINYSQFSSTAEGIRYAMGIYAKKNNQNPYQLLKNRTALSNYLKDLLGNSYPDSTLIQLAITCGIGDILYEAVEQGQSAQKEASVRATERLHHEFAMEYAKADEIVRYFTTALGWKLSEPSQTGHNAVLQNSQPVPVVLTKEHSVSQHPVLKAPQTAYHATIDNVPHQPPVFSAAPPQNHTIPRGTNQNIRPEPAETIVQEVNDNSRHFPVLLIPIFLLLIVFAVLAFWFFQRSQQNNDVISGEQAPMQETLTQLAEISPTSAESPAGQQGKTPQEFEIAETTPPETSVVDIIPQYLVVSGKYTWEDAEKFCQENGGHLASVHSDEQWEALMKVVKEAQKNNANLRYLWLGATSSIDDNMNLSLSWVDGEESNYILQNENVWYYNSKLGMREPSGYDAYEYQQNGKLIREPYLALWIAQKGDSWTLNDLPDVSGYSQYKNDNMGYIMQLPPDAEIPDIPAPTEATVRIEMPATKKTTTAPKKKPSINCYGKVITYENTDYYEYHLCVNSGNYDYYYVECYGYDNSLVLSNTSVSKDLYLTAGSGFDVVAYVTPYFNDGTKGSTITINTFTTEVLKNNTNTFVKPDVYSCYAVGELSFGQNDIVAGYTTDYVCNGGSSSKVRKSLGNHWHVTAYNWCVSRGITWYELYDSDDGDYYGWVDSNYIYFY